MKKRVLSLFLALTMCLSLLPAAAWAEGEDTQEPDSGTTTEAVAKVTMTAYNGTTWTGTYTDLLEAFKAARLGRWTEDDYTTVDADTVSVELLQRGETYTLESDDNYPISFEYGHSVTVDLNGCTLERNVAEYGYGILSVNNDRTDVTFQNGALHYTSSNEYGLPTAIDLAAGTLTLKGMTVTAASTAEDTSACAVYANNESKLNILSGTYSNISKSDNAAVKLSGGFYSDLSSVTDHAGLLAEGYIFAHEDNSYIDPSTMKYNSETDEWDNCANIQVIECDHQGAKFESGTCTRCGAACAHKTVDVDGICETCALQMAAKVGDSYYTTLAAAVEAANGGTVTVLADVEENIAIAEGTTVTIDLNGKTWKGMGTTWVDCQPVPLTVNGGSVTLKSGTLNQGGASDNANHAVIVNGGSLTVDGGMTIRGATVDGDNYYPAIEVKGGELTLSVGANLIFGMSVPEGKTLADYLPENAAFQQAGHVITGDGEYFDSESAKIINSGVQELTGDFMLTVVAHTHDMTNGTCACGFVCRHSSLGFTNGVCGTCGYHCPHDSVMTDPRDGTVKCSFCYAQMVVKVTSGGKDIYYAKLFESNGRTENTLNQVFDKAADGSTITLLADGLYASAWVTNKSITLNLNGKNVIANNGFVVDKDNADVCGKLIVTGSGSSKAPEKVYGGVCTFRVWHGELLFDDNFSGTFGTIYVHGGTLTSVNESQDAIHIGTLDITNSGAKISLKGGTFDTITCSGSKALGDLLAENSGKAFRYTTGDKAFLPYDTEITSSNAVTNVEIATCPHDSITNGTCDYCGTEHIVAAYYDPSSGGVTTYVAESDSAEAINSRVNDVLGNMNQVTGTVKLFADAALQDLTIDTSSRRGPDYHNELVIDLNGCKFTGGTLTLKGNGKLTITDSSAGKTGSFAYVMVKSGASLIADGAYVKRIFANESNSNVLLKAGSKFESINLGNSRLFNCLDEGCCISGKGRMIATMYGGDPLTVMQIPGTVTPPTNKNVSISYGSSVPDSFLPTVTLDDGVEASLTYKWLYRDPISYSSPSDAPVTADGQPLDMICVITANELSGGNTWETAVTGYTLTVTQGQATVTTAPADKNLTYTGSPQELVAAGVANGGEMQYSTDGKNWSATIPTGTDAKEYTVWYKAVGDSNHKDSEAQSLTVKIAPMQLSGTPYVVDKLPTITKGYDGTAEVKIHIDGFVKQDGDLNKEADRVPLTQGKDFDVVDALYDNANVGTGKYASMRFVMKNPNYAFASSNPSYVVHDSASIAKANSSTLSKQNGTLTVAKGTKAAYTYGLSQLLPALPAGRTYGAVSYTASWNGTQDACKNISIKDGVLTAEIDTTQGIGSNSNIKVTVSSTNYDDFTLTINVKAVDKKLPQGEPTLSKDTLTYGDTLSNITLPGTMKDGDTAVAGTFSWTDGTVKPGAGSYAANWKFTPTDDTYAEVTGAAVITVSKATPTGAPKYTAINTSGKTLADAGLTVEDGTFSVPGSVAWELDNTTPVTANTAYKWVFTPNDTANYNTLEDTVTLWRRSSSGGGSSADTKTETTTNPDGSVTKTETKSDGTVIETTTYKDGSTTKTETKPDGSSTTETKDASGSTGTVNTDKNGKTTAEAEISDKAVSDAKKSGEAVKVPTEVKAGEDSSSAPTVKIDLPSGAGETKIEIPVEDATPGTVAIIVKADGTEEIVKDSIPTKDGIRLTVDGDVTVKIVDNAKSFTDTKGHWAEDSIDFVSARGLVSGTGSSTFSPNAATTRAQLWTILARRAGADLTGGANWYEKAQQWAKANGISDGSDPDGNITRAQMVTMLWRAAGSPEAKDSSSFADVSADSYYAKAVAWAVENGITAGVGGGRFAPDDTCTRAQIAVFLHRLCAIK